MHLGRPGRRGASCGTPSQADSPSKDDLAGLADATWQRARATWTEKPKVSVRRCARRCRHPWVGPTLGPARTRLGIDDSCPYQPPQQTPADEGPEAEPEPKSLVHGPRMIVVLEIQSKRRAVLHRGCTRATGASTRDFGLAGQPNYQPECQHRSQCGRVLQTSAPRIVPPFYGAPGNQMMRLEIAPDTAARE